MNLNKQNRKGNIGGIMLGLFLFIALSFIFAVISGVFYFMGSEVNDRLQEKAPDIQDSFSDGVNVSQIMHDTIGEMEGALSLMQWLTMLIIIGMVFAIIFSAYATREHPAWFFFYVLMLVVAVLVSIEISNLYEEIRTDPHLVESFSGFWGQNWIFANFPLWVSVVGVIAGIIIFINMIRVHSEGARF